MLNKFPFVLGLALFVTNAATAEEWTFTEGKVDVHCPDHWKAETDDGSLIIHDKDEEVVIYVELVDAKNLDDAVKHLDKELEKHVKNVKSNDDVKHAKTHGLDVVWVEATGKIDDKDVHIMVDFVTTPNHKVLMLCGIVEDAKWDKHEKDIEAVYEGIKPSDKKKKK